MRFAITRLLTSVSCCAQCTTRPKTYSPRAATLTSTRIALTWGDLNFSIAVIRECKDTTCPAITLWVLSASRAVLLRAHDTYDSISTRSSASVSRPSSAESP